MAAVEVTISGVLYDKLSRSTRPVVLIGEASLTGLEVGGGPMPPGQGGGPIDPGYGRPPPTWGGAGQPYPPGGGGGGGPGSGPDHIWGPTDPRPNPPIYLPPNITPPVPVEPGDKPPPDDRAGWGYYDGRWGYFPGPDEAGPK